MVDAQPFVAIPSAGLVIPIGVKADLGVQGPKRIGVPEMAEGAKAGTGLRTAQSVVGKSQWIVDVMVGGTDVKVTPQYHSLFQGEE
jgi:hypothetical protein